jgi:hypothetical protein
VKEFVMRKVIETYEGQLEHLQRMAERIGVLLLGGRLVTHVLAPWPDERYREEMEALIKEIEAIHYRSYIPPRTNSIFDNDDPSWARYSALKALEAVKERNWPEARDHLRAALEKLREMATVGEKFLPEVLDDF